MDHELRFQQSQQRGMKCGLADGKTEAVSWQKSAPEKSEFMGSQNTNHSWKRGKGGKELESRVLFK